MRSLSHVPLIRRRSAGFSLTELMIVLVIFGIVSAVALPGLNRFLRSLDLNNAVNATATRLRVVRQRAITENNIYRCWYSPWYRDFGWWDDDNNDGMWQMTEKWDAGQIQPAWISVDDEPSNPFTLFWIEFNPNGSANQSGTKVYTNSDGYSRSLSIVRPTGMVTVQ